MNTTEEILNHWQKKPLLIKNFFSASELSGVLSADELAGLALDGATARIVSGNYSQKNWKLLQQPFAEDIFSTLPEKDWTLLVQGMDRFIPEIYHLIDKFNTVPRWKFDDVMMSYAATGGSVGPHFDYYDVFLVQTTGTRKWQLSTKGCTEENYNKGFDLKVMKEFEPEVEYIVEPGDALYIPPKVAHFGTSLSDDCTTLSFGYRSYHSNEIADFAGNTASVDGYYQDSMRDARNTSALITSSAVCSANALVRISAEEFAEFVTTTDLADEEVMSECETSEDFDASSTYILHPCLKIAYLENLAVFIAGAEFTYNEQDAIQIIQFCNTREINGSSTLARELFELGFLQTKVVE